MQVESLFGVEGVGCLLSMLDSHEWLITMVPWVLLMMVVMLRM